MTAEWLSLALPLLVAVCFLLGYAKGTHDEQQIGLKYGADHTYNPDCWCRRPGHSCAFVDSPSYHRKGTDGHA